MWWSNTLSPGDKVLMFETGHFAVQWQRVARALGLDVRFFHSNHEGDYVEELHKAPDYADALLLNPGAWTHYAWAIHDALESLTIPIVEVHLSNVDEREEWRRKSVVADLVAARFVGHGPDGYKLALEHLKEATQ